MSFEDISWAMDQKLSAREKIVLIVLANRRNATTGRCDPSVERIASDAGMSKSSVRAALRSLVGAGLVTSTTRRVDSTNLPNSYSLHRLKSAPVVQNTHHPTAGFEVGVVQNTHPKQEVKTVIEPSRANEAVEIVFDYYLQKLKKNPKLYCLTPKRRENAVACYRHCLKVSDGNDESALHRMQDAVDGLCANDWLMGRSQNSTRQYTDWEEYVFKNIETMEKRWEDFQRRRTS